ncbi:MAG: thrombospondin type 3 repeat-containing protein [Gammaproteobacteria bacterium]|nr:thrombospondin type 3 repeat-containing protein [Gammaproteobacteria bacterium]
MPDYLYGNESESFIAVDDFSFGKDSDGDGVPDSTDNCPADPNSWQTDSDDDGIGDICDNDPYSDDPDGDGYGNPKDNCPSISNPDQSDIDNDGIGDLCDETDNRPVDSDGDLYSDYLDNCPSISNPDQSDMDRDGKGDVCDDDLDGDGISNTIEQGYDFLDETDPTDGFKDYDGDGVNNSFEINSGFKPDVADNFETLDLYDYFPMGDYVRTYGNEFTQRELRIESSAIPNKYVSKISDSNWTMFYEKRADGLYLTGEQNNSYSPARTIEYSGMLVYPYKLKLGEIVTGIATMTVRNGDTTGYTDQMNYSYQLIATGTSNWRGQVYNTITLKVTFAVDGVYYFSRDVVYMEGIGQMELDGLPLLATESPNKPLNDDISVHSTSTEKRTVFGSLSWPIYAIMMLGLVLRIRTRTRYRHPRKGVVATS